MHNNAEMPWFGPGNKFSCERTRESNDGIQRNRTVMLARWQYIYYMRDRFFFFGSFEIMSQILEENFFFLNNS